MKLPSEKKVSSRPTLRVAMLSYSFYEADNRVRRYSETLARLGDTVEVFSLRRPSQSDYYELNGVRIHRIQERVRNEKGKWDYLSRILKFFIRSAILLTKKHIAQPFDLIHVHSVPDFEVFAALVPKLLGAKVILDIHDIVPELFCNKFRLKKDGLPFKMLIFAEKTAIGFSDHTIISNDLWKERLASRSVRAEKCTSILNYPDIHLFCSNGFEKNNEKIVLLYPGTLNYHQGLDIAIRAFAKIKDSVPNAEFQIYGEGPAREELVKLINNHRLQGRVFLEDPVPLDEIVKIMGSAHIGVIPKKNDDFGGEAFSTKTLEFMTLGVPIIVARTKIDQFYFNNSIVRFFEPENVDDLAEAMLELIKKEALRNGLSKRALEFAKKQSWELKKQGYLDLVDSLCQARQMVRFNANG